MHHRVAGYGVAYDYRAEGGAAEAVETEELDTQPPAVVSLVPVLPRCGGDWRFEKYKTVCSRSLAPVG